MMDLSMSSISMHLSSIWKYGRTNGNLLGMFLGYKAYSEAIAVQSFSAYMIPSALSFSGAFTFDIYTRALVDTMDDLRSRYEENMSFPRSFTKW